MVHGLSENFGSEEEFRINPNLVVSHQSFQRRRERRERGRERERERGERERER